MRREDIAEFFFGVGLVLGTVVLAMSAVVVVGLLVFGVLGIAV